MSSHLFRTFRVEENENRMARRVQRNYSISIILFRQTVAATTIGDTTVADTTVAATTIAATTVADTTIGITTVGP